MRKAFTLLEMILAMTLFLTVLGLLVGIFIPTLRVYLFSRSRLEVRQAAVQALYLLTSEIQNSEAESITLAATPTSNVPVALSLVQISGFSVSGNMMWYPGFELFYFDQSQQKLLWKRIPTPGGYDFSQAAPPALNQADLVTQLNNSALELRVVALNLNNMTINGPNPVTAYITYPLNITIDTRIEDPYDPASPTKIELFHLETAINPRSKRW